MNDVSTRQIVVHILQRMGFKELAKHASKEDTDINGYINYIKYKDRKNIELNSFIRYWL